MTEDADYEAHRLVYHFLRSHNYSAAADSLLHDDHLPPRLAARLQRPEPVTTGGGHGLTDIVEDWLAARLSRTKLDDPSAPLLEEIQRLELKGKLPEHVRTAVRESTNVLTVKRGALPKRSWDSDELRFKSEEIPCIFTTAVDRTLKVYSISSFDLLDSFSLPSPALAFAQHPQAEHSRFVACGTMEGSLTVFDLVAREVKAKVKNHNKYIVRAAWSPDGHYLATLGYDKLIHIYRFSLSTASSSSSDAPALLDDEAPDPLAHTPDVSLALVHTATTRTNPEAAVFLPDSDWLVWTARDDHLLHYLRVPAAGEKETKGGAWEENTYNLNENGDAFVSFSVLTLTLHPCLPLLSLQTSTSTARLLLYPFHSSTRLLTLHTTASQSDYFAPRHTWLPDGSAAVVNSEDGIIRLIDLSGRVRLAKGAHGPAAPLETAEGEVSEELRSERARARREADKGSSVVRDVEVLPHYGDAGEVALLSCGFDKTVKVLEVV
ncbi:hypothetical protein JCM8547_001778 [Rhodosporidiobolus lusitaniae]